MRSSWKIALVGCLLPFLGFGSLSHAQQNPTREATLRWRPMEGAAQYELELSKVAEMDPVLYKKSLPATELKLKLPPATYYFRVRGKTAKGTPGPWSDVQGFIVSTDSPTPLQPSEGTVFKDKLDSRGIVFQWKEPPLNTQLKLEIRDQKGVWIDRILPGTEYEFMPRDPGDYEWRVGFVSQSRIDWSPFVKFKVLPSAVDQKRVVVYRDEKKPESTNAEWSIILRGAQALYNQTAQDSELSISNSSAFGFGSFYSLELRFRAPRPSTSTWLFSGSLNGELASQKVNGVSFSLPRAYLRTYYTGRLGDWRIGPLLHFSYSTIGVYLTNNAAFNPQTRNFNVQRMSPGLGVVAVYQASSSLYWSALALGRYDMGGTSPTVNELLPTIGIEAGFGLVVGLSEHFLLEGRLRYMTEEVRWKQTDPSQESFFKNSYIILDLGVGYKF